MPKMNMFAQLYHSIIFGDGVYEIYMHIFVCSPCITPNKISCWLSTHEFLKKMFTIIYSKEFVSKCLSTTFDTNHLVFEKVKCQSFPKYAVKKSSTRGRLANGCGPLDEIKLSFMRLLVMTPRTLLRFH